MEEFLLQLNQDIKDIFEHDITTTKAYLVPTRDDPTLTFTIGSDKQGKLLETCVLMIDIRNSTKLSRRLRRDKIKLGKIYSAFVYAMTSIADKYGYVRNIVGDRVMVVFQPENCFVEAINCAALMYTVGHMILPKLVGVEDFKVGIGIDHGELLVLKTGIRKRYEEQPEHKGLVWVGDAANTASKLCDYANKNYSSPIFKITYEVSNIEKIYKESSLGLLNKDLNSLLEIMNPGIAYEYRNSTKNFNAELDHEQFATNVIINSDGWKYNGNKVTNFNIVNRAGTTSPILVSGKVYSEYKKAEPKSRYLFRLSPKDYPDKPCYSIYGGSLFIPEYTKLRRELS